MNAVYPEKPALAARIRALAESYSQSYRKYQEAREAFGKDRAELMPLLANFKKLVGVGRDGGFRPFVHSLNLPVPFKSIDCAVRRARCQEREARMRQERERRTDLIVNRHGWKTVRGKACYVGDDAMA